MLKRRRASSVDEFDYLLLKPLTKEFRSRYSKNVFIYHPLPEKEETGKNIKKFHETRDRKLPFLRKQFIEWLKIERERSDYVQKVVNDALNKDVAFGRAWFWIVRQNTFPTKFRSSEIVKKKVKNLRENSKTRTIAEECLEWMWAAERLGILNFYLGYYGNVENVWSRKVIACRQFLPKKLKRPGTAINITNLTRITIGQYMSERHGLIFDDSWVEPEHPCITWQVRLQIFTMINNYQNDLQAKLLPYVPHPEKTQKFMDIILSEEMTRAAYASIQLYLITLRRARNAIKIDCTLLEKRLSFHIDQIKEDLQAAILELGDQERIKILPEDLDDFLEQLNEFVDKTLHIDRFQRRYPTGDFLKLIYNDQVPIEATEKQLTDRLKITREQLLHLDKLPETLECGIFCVEMSDVWRTLIERGQERILECSQRLRKSFHTSLMELHEEFERFKKILSFRSMDPALMLANKAEVIKICDEDMPKAIQKLVHIYDRMDNLTQMVQFDTNEHDLLIAIVALRRSLPRQLANHKLFFQRRYNVFTHFVRNLQQKVQTNAQIYSEKLKIINTFTNPNEVDEYLKEMIALKPLILSLLEEIAHLNEYERVVNFTITTMPQIELLGKHVDGLWSLFDWTKKFQEYQSTLYGKRRVEANVDEAKEFVDIYLNALADLNTQLEGQRAARHFIVQIRSEVERFRMTFPVIEVLSCARFDERHWTKMSDIVGYDLSLYSNAKVSQIIELGLGQYVTRLKPIAFIAEREGKIADETTNIEDFWTETNFHTEQSIFWNISLPVNLEDLIKHALIHMEKLQNFIDTADKDSVFKESHEKWMTKLRKFHSIVKKWSKILNRWRRISFVMHHSHNKIFHEFDEFRTCAKFWKKFEQHIEKEPKAIKIIDENHVECWLHTVERHLRKMFEGLQNFFRKIRHSSARICLISNTALLKLMSNIALEKSLTILRRECFPFIKDMFINNKNQIAGITIDDESFNLPLTSDGLNDVGLLEQVEKIEDSLNTRILDAYKKYIENRDENLSIFSNLVRLLDHYIHPRNQELSYFDYKFKEDFISIKYKSSISEIPLSVEYVPTDKFPLVSESFTKNWVAGKVPFGFGRLQDCRNVARGMSQLLCCSLHFISAHDWIKLDVIDIIIHAARQNSIIIVFENIDQLNIKTLKYLLGNIEDLRKHMLPRLFLYSTLSSTVQAIREANIQAISDHEINRLTTLTLYRDESLSITSASSPHMKRLSSMRRRQSTPRPKTLADTLLNATIMNEGQIMELSFACVGISARETIEEAVNKCQAEASWIYLDVFTAQQLVSQSNEFGVEAEGFLMKNLSEKMKRDHQSSQSLLTTPEDAKDPDKRRLSLQLRPHRFIIFYGYQLFDTHFPIISSLFCAQPGHADTPPGSYVTLPDGSNFYAASNIRFVLCIPNCDKRLMTWFERYDIRTIVVDMRYEQSLYDQWWYWKTRYQNLMERQEFIDVLTNSVEMIVLPLYEKLNYNLMCNVKIMFEHLFQDLKELLPFVFPTNCGELVRWTVCSTCINFLVLFLNDPHKKIDNLTEELAKLADRHAMEPGKLPADISQWKLSAQDFARWVKWYEEPHIRSCLDRDAAMSDLFVMYPDLDRLLTYMARRFFNFSDHILFTGPTNSGKTATVKRLIKFVQSTNELYNFINLDCMDRFNLFSMQTKLNNLFESSKIGKTTVLIIDHFTMSEAVLALLELYLNEMLIIDEGIPMEFGKKIKLLLIMDEGDVQKYRQHELFVRKFTAIPIKPPLVHDILTLLEQIISWHFSTKNFSAEYQTIVTSIAAASNKLFGIAEIEPDKRLPYAIRLAKGLMFSYPDNTPDIDSMLRLWCHEIIRVILDKCTKIHIREKFLDQFDRVLMEELKTSLKILFPSKLASIDDEDEPDFYAKHAHGQVVFPNFQLEKLMFSEMAGMDVLEGLAYGVITDREEFNRSLENLHFEYCRNHEEFRINLVMTNYMSEHCQRIMRICRQSNEHLVLAGKAGSGRFQCIKLATFGVVGQVLNVYLNTSDPNAFESCWKTVIKRAIQIVSTINQIVNIVFHMNYGADKIPLPWIAMIQQWFQNPTIGSLVRDDIILKHAEQILSAEKGLATQVQSSNIRLPGQRYTQFLSLDALKDVEILKTTLSARISDFVHAIFLVSPDAMHMFEWCSGDYFSSLAKEETSQMVEKVIGECVYEDKEKLIRVLRQIFAETLKFFGKSGQKPVIKDLYADSKLLYDFCQYVVDIFNEKKKRLSEKLKTLKSALKNSTQIQELNSQEKLISATKLAKMQDDNDLIVLLLRRNYNIALECVESLEKKIDEVTQEFNGTNSELSVHNQVIETVMEAPKKEYDNALSKVFAFSFPDFKKLGSTLKPNLGVRYTIEAVRKLIEPGFEPTKNTLETWKSSQEALQKRFFMECLKNFDPTLVTGDLSKSMKKYLENQEFKLPKIEQESKLAGALHTWFYAALNLAKANRTLVKHWKASTILSGQAEFLQGILDEKQAEKEKLENRIKALEMEIRELEDKILKTRRLLDYQRRSEQLIGVIQKYKYRWQNDVDQTEASIKECLGDSILSSGYRVLCASQNFDQQKAISAVWKSLIVQNSISYNDTRNSLSNLFYDFLENIVWQHPWPLILTVNEKILQLFNRIYPNSIILDMSTRNWMDTHVLDELIRASRLQKVIIFANLITTPPAQWFDLLKREPDKENFYVYIGEILIRFSPGFKIIFHSKMPIAKFELQFLRMISPLVIPEVLETLEKITIDEKLKSEETLILRILSDFMATEILESQEITDQIVKMCEL